MFETTLPGFFPFDTSCQKQQLETPKPPCVCEMLRKKLPWRITHNPSGPPQRKLLGSSYACYLLPAMALFQQLSGLNAWRPKDLEQVYSRIQARAGLMEKKCLVTFKHLLWLQKGLRFVHKEPFYRCEVQDRDLSWICTRSTFQHRQHFLKLTGVLTSCWNISSSLTIQTSSAVKPREFQTDNHHFDLILTTRLNWWLPGEIEFSQISDKHHVDTATIGFLSFFIM